MEISRRDFLKISGTTAVAFALGCGSKIKPAEDKIPPIAPWIDTREVKYGKETTTICPYCGVGCGIVVSSNWVDGVWKVVNTEGDPDHPINEGTLCSKGNALYQVANNERRLTKVQYRAPGSDKWEEKDWTWAINTIAQRIKDTRDSNFTEDDGTYLVNRTDAIGSFGGAALDNEECYLFSKLTRALGLVYIEHCARI